MTFDEAEAKFRDLQSRVQRGEAISRAEYEDQVSQLAVQDDRGVLWEINPRTGKWMYFDGAEWVGGTPPGRDHSTVMPVPRAPTPSTEPVSNPRPFTSSTPPPSASTTPPTRPSPPPTRATPVIPPVRTAVGTAPMARTANPASPEAVPVYERKKAGQTGGNPPSEGGGTPPGGNLPGNLAPRFLREGPFAGPNREWVPLAIGAAVLLLCAVLLFFGGRFVLGALGPSSAPSPTRPSALALASSTPLPTLVRLPTAVLPTSTPQPVLAKVIENTVNVRAEPNTKAKIVSSLKKNNQISLVGRNEAGDWYQINLTGGAAPAWVFAATLQVVSGDPKALPVVGAAAPAPATKAPGPSVVPTPTIIGGKPPGQ